MTSSRLRADPMSCGGQIGNQRPNLSVPPRSVIVMTDTTPKDQDAIHVFDDPVGYLSGLGVTAELVAETALPVAA